MTQAPSVENDLSTSASHGSDSVASEVAIIARPWQHRTVVPTAAAVAYIVLAALAYMPVWEHWQSQLNGCNCWDQIMEQWFISWPSAAIVHGHSLLTSSYLNAPGGVNLMWNTSMPALGFLASPMVALIGPIHTFTVLLTLGFASSSWAMFFLLRRWGTSNVAAWLGGLIYGFSSLAVAEGIAGRLNLLWWPLPPLMLMLLDRIISDQRPKPIRTGIVIGVLITVQMLTNEEALPIMAILAIVALLVGVVRCDSRRVLAERASTLTRAGLATFCTFAVLLSYPLYIQFWGPYKLTGPVQSLHQLAAFRADLASPIIPDLVQKLDPDWAQRISDTFSNNPTEVTEYLGIPLLLFLLIGIAFRRRTRVAILGSICLISFLLSLGPKIIIATHLTWIPGPYDILLHLPLFKDIMPSRFGIGLWFGASGLFAYFIDELDGAIRRRVRWPSRAGSHYASGPPRYVLATRPTRRSSIVGLVAPVVGVLCLVPLIPNWPYAELPAAVPTFFTSRALEAIPQGALVATYPYPVTSIDQPMDWQAQTGMRFRLLGGYDIGPDADGSGTYFAFPNTIEYCLVQVYVHGVVEGGICAPHQIASALKTLGVTAVLIGVAEPHADIARGVFSSALNALPRAVGGVLVWRCVSQPLSGECAWK